MGACILFATILLVLINIIVALFSLFFLCVGIGFAVAVDIMQTVIITQLGSILGDLPSPNGGELPSPNGGEPLNLEAILLNQDIDVFGFLKTLSIPIICVSLVILIISLLGCCGACCKNKCLLGIYSLVMTLVVIAILSGCLIVYMKYDTWVNEWKANLAKTVHDKYVGETSGDAISAIFTVLHVQYECCGVISGEDFVDSKVLNRTLTGQVLPFSCCVGIKEGDIDSDKVKNCVRDDYKNKVYSNYNTGCFDELETFLKDYTNYILIALVCSTVSLIILCVLGWCLFAHVVKMDKEAKGEYYDDNMYRDGRIPPGKRF